MHNHPSTTRDEEEQTAKAIIKRLGKPRGMRLTKDDLRSLNPEYYDANVARRKETLSTRVGLTLSYADIEIASKFDMAGIRARTEGGFIYSLERGKNGWGASPKTLSGKLMQYLSEERAKNRNYVQSGATLRDKMERNSKSEVVSQHRALARLAKEYGLKYTRRKA